MLYGQVFEFVCVENFYFCLNNVWFCQVYDDFFDDDIIFGGSLYWCCFMDYIEFCLILNGVQDVFSFGRIRVLLNLVDMIECGLRGEFIICEEVFEIFCSSDDEFMLIIVVVGKVCCYFFDNWVCFNYLVNFKFGLCFEDCFYCLQCLGLCVEIMKYFWVDLQKVYDVVEVGIVGGVCCVCMVVFGYGLFW